MAAVPSARLLLVIPEHRGDLRDSGKHRRPVPRRVTVGVLTYRREMQLARLLDALEPQFYDVQLRWSGGYNCRVLVVDNDPAGGAASVAEERGGRLDYRLDYVCEATPGIAAARNRVLDCTPDDDILVFIDDDETPRPSLLVALLETFSDYSCGAVTGPVVSGFEAEPDPFIVAGRFFARDHRSDLRTGQRVHRAATNNLLLDLHTVRRLGVRFDAAFGATGGEDSVFTGELDRAGVPMVWCAEAVVTDHVPAARMTRSYVLQRTATLANSSLRAELRLHPSRLDRTAIRLRSCAGEVIRLVGGLVLTARGMVTGSVRHEAQGRRKLARARGALGAVIGVQRTPYARPSGAG